MLCDVHMFAVPRVSESISESMLLLLLLLRLLLLRGLVRLMRCLFREVPRISAGRREGSKARTFDGGRAGLGQ
jgi:hypothetical protein